MTFDTTTILIVAAILAVAVLALLMLRSRPRRAEGRAPARGRKPLCRGDRAALYEEAGGQRASPTRSPRRPTTSPARCSASPPATRPPGPADDLSRLKGVGPKFVARLNELGIARYDQLAGLNANEAAHLDERMGPFQGRLARDRVIEQADYLARGDIEGFEEKFGNGRLARGIVRHPDEVRTYDTATAGAIRVHGS